LCLIPREEILPVTATNLVHIIIRYVGNVAYIIEVLLGVKVERYHDLVACRPKASGSLIIALGRKDTLTKNTKCSIFILMIFRQFVMSSGFLLSMIALFRIKCRSNALALCVIVTILFAKGRGLHI